ncbi:MAG: HWE histidine kinase domain-containing protein [Sphingobium sp.]|uniref:sensor histidine kinase n=1 Tax=Sphingobium sp. TaxID=1912891 RepID=UPI0029AFCC86|nr:HWE histidine kinase domain-containing protein [Sphingobium sp.]MDX3911675.1 HWE histidine kinase domain-containing protein [Sphingobium sp.]
MSAEVLGQPIEVLIPRRFQDRHRTEIVGFVSAAASTHRSMGVGREVMGMHKTGREFAIEATLSSHMVAGQPIFTAAVRDVTERQTADQKRQLVAGEVAHRLRNTMAVVNSVVSMTARGAVSVPDFESTLVGRFSAISRTNDALICGTQNNACLRALLLSELAPFQDQGGRITLVGPDVQIEGKLALDLALIFHELATNAAKYGALSIADGVIEVDWEVSLNNPPALELVWRERGGPEVRSPKKVGFGSKLISRILRGYGGVTKIVYDPSGVYCTVSLPTLS